MAPREPFFIAPDGGRSVRGPVGGPLLFKAHARRQTGH